MESNSVESIVTDPPYGLSFMGKDWDHGVPGIPFWAEGLRLLKPGGHLLAFGGTRTHHRLACAIEDAGFEIRDSIHWIYGTGFPKSHNLDGGIGTALKPAHEPIVLTRKPLEGTVAANVEKWGTGGMNVDSCRVAPTGERLGGGCEKRATFEKSEGWSRPWMSDPRHAKAHAEKMIRNVDKATEVGRWPPNVVLSPEAAEEMDRQSGMLKSGDWPTRRNTDKFRNIYGEFKGGETGGRSTNEGGASRFFPIFRYEPKASSGERSEGLQDRNVHPTVKPVALMRWLCRLVTPRGGLILDPFVGSGTTGIAGIREGFQFIGIELNPEYCEMARKRIEADMPLFNVLHAEAVSS